MDKNYDTELEFDDSEFDDSEFENDEFDDSEIEDDTEEQTDVSLSEDEQLTDEQDSEFDDSDVDADEFGSEIDLAEEGLAEPEPVRVASTADFLNNTGDISVMDSNQSNLGSSFDFIQNLPIQSLVIGNRIRQKPSVTALTQSVKMTGLLEPIIVAPTMTNGIYLLVKGLRRVLAVSRAGGTTIPAVVNKRLKSNELLVVEALYNQYTPYTMSECSEFIKKMESRGLMSPSLFEMLLQWNSGDFSKYKDIMDDGDPDIITKLFDGEFTIAQAFQALEKRRKKESREEKQIKTTEKAYSGETPEIAEGLTNTGVEVEEEEEHLTDEQIKDLMFDPMQLDEIADSSDLDQMVEEGNKMEGFEPHKQDYKNREILDPAIRKAVLARDDNTCQCCKRGGPDYVDILDVHHIVEVYLGGEDSVDNSTTACLNCHKQIHLYAFGKLTIPKELTPDELEAKTDQYIAEVNLNRKKSGIDPMSSELEKEYRVDYQARYRAERDKYKRIVYLGNIIRKGLQERKISKEQAAKEHPINSIGRMKPGQASIRG